MIRRGISPVQTGLDPAQSILIVINTIIIIIIRTVVVNHWHHSYIGRSDDGIVHGRHEQRSLSAFLYLVDAFWLGGGTRDGRAGRGGKHNLG